MAKTHWASDWKVEIRVWVERQGHAILGEGRAELLAAIDTERSITKAAKAAGMSYRRAWTMIQEVNEASGETLVEAAVGGKQGGGARLTERGRLALEVYGRVRHSLVESAANVLRQSILPTVDTDHCIHLAAAISLQEAVGQILAEYALREPTVRVRAIFGASNELADHLLAGAGRCFYYRGAGRIKATSRGQARGSWLTTKRCHERPGHRWCEEIRCGQQADRPSRSVVQTRGSCGTCLPAGPVLEGVSPKGASVRQAPAESAARR